eukprot:RCo023167
MKEPSPPPSVSSARGTGTSRGVARARGIGREGAQRVPSARGRRGGVPREQRGALSAGQTGLVQGVEVPHAVAVAQAEPHQQRRGGPDGQVDGKRELPLVRAGREHRAVVPWVAPEASGQQAPALVRGPHGLRKVPPRADEVQQVGARVAVASSTVQAKHGIRKLQRCLPRGLLVQKRPLRVVERHKPALGAERVALAVLLEVRKCGLDPARVEHHRHDRGDGQELDPVHKESLLAKVRLELHQQIVQDTNHGVLVLLGVDLLVWRDVPVVIGGVDLHQHHGLSNLHQQLGLRGQAIQVDSVPSVHSLAGGLLVLPVGIGHDAESPRVSHVPVKVTEAGEVRVRRAWVGNVSDEDQHLLVVALCPVGVELGHDCGTVDEVAVVEVVIVVVRIAEVEVGVLERGALQPRLVVGADGVSSRWRPLLLNPNVLASAGNQTSPGLVIDKQVLRLMVQPSGEIAAKPVQHVVGNLGLPQLVRDQHNACHLGQQLARIVWVNHPLLHIPRQIKRSVRVVAAALEVVHDGGDLRTVGGANPRNWLRGVQQPPNVARYLHSEAVTASVEVTPAEDHPGRAVAGQQAEVVRQRDHRHQPSGQSGPAPVVLEVERHRDHPADVVRAQDRALRAHVAPDIQGCLVVGDVGIVVDVGHVGGGTMRGDVVQACGAVVHQGHSNDPREALLWGQEVARWAGLALHSSSRRDPHHPLLVTVAQHRGELVPRVLGSVAGDLLPIQGEAPNPLEGSDGGGRCVGVLHGHVGAAVQNSRLHGGPPLHGEADLVGPFHAITARPASVDHPVPVDNVLHNVALRHDPRVGDFHPVLDDVEHVGELGNIVLPDRARGEGGGSPPLVRRGASGLVKAQQVLAGADVGLALDCGIALVHGVPHGNRVEGLGQHVGGVLRHRQRLLRGPRGERLLVPSLSLVGARRRSLRGLRLQDASHQPAHLRANLRVLHDHYRLASRSGGANPGALHAVRHGHRVDQFPIKILVLDTVPL